MLLQLSVCKVTSQQHELSRRAACKEGLLRPPKVLRWSTSMQAEHLEDCIAEKVIQMISRDLSDCRNVGGLKFGQQNRLLWHRRSPCQVSDPVAQLIVLLNFL